MLIDHWKHTFKVYSPQIVWKHMSFRNAAWMSPLKVYEQSQ